MLYPPSDASQRRSYTLLQEILSGMDTSFTKNIRDLTRRACELTGSPVSIYSRLKSSCTDRYVAAGHNISKMLVGEPLPQEIEGPEMKRWALEHTGLGYMISLPVSLKEDVVGFLTILSDEPRRLSNEEYDAFESIALAFSYSEGQHDAFSAMVYHNRLRNAIFSINKNLSREKRRDEMLLNVCRELVDKQGAYNAWIALVDDDLRPDGQVFHAGFSDSQFTSMELMLKKGRIPHCASLALRTPGIQIINAPSVICRSCPLSKGYEDRGGLCAQIAFNNRRYGWLTVSVPGEYIADHVEQVVLSVLAELLGMSLYYMELDRERLEAQRRREVMLDYFERLSAFRLKLLKMMKSAAVREIMRQTVDEAERWTGSLIGFFHFIEEDGGLLSLQTWSTRTSSTMCHLKDVEGHYLLQDAGIWADAVRKKDFVIHNSYSAVPGRKGLPEGHSEIIRELVVPIIREGRVKAILGIGNKPDDYEEEDARWIGALADHAWDIIENKMYLEQQDSLRIQLEHAKKMEMVGNLAAGITHEINNPLNFISVNLSNLERDCADLSELVALYRQKLGTVEESGLCADVTGMIRERERSCDIEGLLGDLPNLLGSTRNGVERITGITRSMRNLSFKSMTDARALADINKVIRDVVVIASHESAGVASIHTEPGDIPLVDCNPSQISQVVLNLLMNSLYAIRSQKRLEQASVVIRTWLDGGYVYCSVADDGPGIDESIREEIFTPFFTTKEQGIGTGLGLSISYDIIVQKHNGKFTFACPLDGGTVFTLALPL
jgi:signal transduction histidine kinase